MKYPTYTVTLRRGEKEHVVHVDKALANLVPESDRERMLLAEAEPCTVDWLAGQPAQGTVRGAITEALDAVYHPKERIESRGFTWEIGEGELDDGF